MKPGPKPYAQEIHEINGNPSKKALPKDILRAKGDPVRPESLTGYARETWERIITSAPPGVYGEAESPLLVAYCLAAEKQIGAYEMLRLTGGEVIYPTIVVYSRRLDDWDEKPDGKPMRNPWGLVLHEASADVARFGALLGLDPIARQSIRTGKPDEPAKPSKFGGTLGVVQGGKSA